MCYGQAVNVPIQLNSFELWFGGANRSNITSQRFLFWAFPIFVSAYVLFFAGEFCVFIFVRADVVILLQDRFFCRTTQIPNAIKNSKNNNENDFQISARER